MYGRTMNRDETSGKEKMRPGVIERRNKAIASAIAVRHYIEDRLPKTEQLSPQPVRCSPSSHLSIRVRLRATSPSTLLAPLTGRASQRTAPSLGLQLVINARAADTVLPYRLRQTC